MLQVQDPNLGTIDYTFDIAGNVLSRVDAKGQTQLWEYGAANRLLAHHSLYGPGDTSGLSDYSHTFHYDAADPDGPLSDASNLLGELAYVEYPTGRSHYSYDSLVAKRPAEASPHKHPSRVDLTPLLRSR